MARNHDLDRLAREMRGASPFRGSLLLAVILLFLAAAAVWAARTELDDVTRAEGRIVPSRDVQVIQATEPGILQAVHVAEGEIVEAGAVLMELDGTQISSELDQEQQRAFGLMARIDRLQAEIDGTGLSYADTLIERAPDVVRSETALFHGREAELADEIDILERQRSQRRQHFEEGRVDLQTARDTLQVLADERGMMAPLVERGVEPATTLLTLRRTEAEWRGRETRAQAALARLQSALDEIDDQVRALRSRQRAPVRGVVNRIHRSTLGGLARAGEDLIEIVPLDDTLLVEAYLRPADIAFIHPGQRVKVKITAYDFSRYGSLDGEIVRIGADAVTRSERDEEEFFVVQIRTDDNILGADGVAVEIMPGMITQVDILAGRKTVMEYLTRPVVRVKENALRE